MFWNWDKNKQMDRLAQDPNLETSRRVEISETATALSIWLENGMNKNPHLWRPWKNFVHRVAQAMLAEDDPRFSLYDLLDGVLTAMEPVDWPKLSGDELRRVVYKNAELKRAAYESDIMSCD